jgi:subtilisin family serine protease
MKKTTFVGGFILLAVMLIAGGPVYTQQPVPAEQVDVAQDETPRAWFVELHGAPTADGGSAAALASEKQAFRAAAKAAGIAMRERFEYSRLWNGLSVEVAPGELSRLTRLAAVKNVFPVVNMTVPETSTGEQPELATAVSMTQADIAQNELGLSGQGVRVAIMDTGVDYDHPDLGGCFGQGCRVEVGWDFVGDAYNNDSTSPAYNPVATPDAFPDDCNGHGTHVAGIVGASGGVTGVAPGVTFAAYRVFGCEGSTSSDIMIAAMERALQDGADVLNMSIGSSFQWPQYPTAQAADRLVNKGVVVVASAGNSGTSGAWATSAPSLGKKVISVASFANTFSNSPAFTITPDGRRVGYGNATAAPPAPFSGSYPMARTGATPSTAEGCVASPAGSFTGKVVLIRRGTCGFYDKALHAQNAGASAVVLYNNAAGTINPTVAPVAPATTPIVIPVVAITLADGVEINNRIASGTVDMTWTSESISTPNPGANLISSFSSYGMSPDLVLKPDLGAPGGNIRSTVPLEQGRYANISGTSMSSPHVAGAVALLLEARPHTPSQAVRSILQNTASPRLWFGNPALGFLELTHRQGAGMLQIADAIQSSAKVEPGKLSLGEFETGATPNVHTLRVENNGSSAVTYHVSHAPALASNGTFTVGFFNAPAQVALSSHIVTVAPGGSATVDVTVAPNVALADRAQYGGWVVFTPEGDGQTLRVPFAGLKGDYQSIQVLTPTANGFPWLARSVGTSFVNQPSGGSFTMAGADIPNFVVHLDHQSRELKFEVFDAATGKSWHRILTESYVPRNSGAATFFVFDWDGETRGGNKIYTVPNGQYVVKLTVTKALGDSTNPAHVETWTSPVVTIARP